MGLTSVGSVSVLELEMEVGLIISRYSPNTGLDREVYTSGLYSLSFSGMPQVIRLRLQTRLV